MMNAIVTCSVKNEWTFDVCHLQTGDSHQYHYITPVQVDRYTLDGQDIF